MSSDIALVKVLRKTGILGEEVDPSLFHSRHSCPIRILGRRGFFDELAAIQKVALHLGVRYLDLFDPLVSAKLTLGEFLSKIDQQLLRAHHMLPLYQEGGKVLVALANPLDSEGVKLLSFALGAPLTVAIADEAKIVSLLSSSAPQTTIDFDAMEQIEPDEEVEFLGSTQKEENLDTELVDTPPIVRIVNKIISDAVVANASDIHVDPTPSGIDIRFRIDGVMQHVMDAPKRVQLPIVSRLKLIAGMDIAERRKPQDGRARVRVATEPIDLRVSALPTAHGEKIVIRLLSSNFDDLNFSRLAMPPEIEKNLMRDLSLTGKLILVTGPTGSGKTTTLYTCLKQLRDGSTNIETVEDPIEYRIGGINQVQINEPAGLSFASVLRSILRQDPDVIMIGEIRDAETAAIALQAAQTGHMVLSTLHTNDAPSAITRLLNLNADAFAIAASLQSVLAQRLVRRICDSCNSPMPAAAIASYSKVIEAYKLDPKELRVGLGCEACRFTGFRGRLGLYSYLPVNPEVAALIVRGASLQEFSAVAVKYGCQSLDQSAIELLRTGKTSLSEVRCYLNETEHAASAAAAAHDTTVMVVEDDLECRKKIGFMLGKEGYKIVEAKNGAEALQQLLSSKPDLIVSGLGMPVMDGRTFIQRVKAEDNFNQIPIVVLTSADSDENESELLDMGVDDFVSRARGPEVILKRVKRALSL
ncbi:MAG: type II/IV secretion system protein [Oligoflexia bacterium]|nr:type II/IV secretion system protein [Oligoflexia bacterium]